MKNLNIVTFFGILFFMSYFTFSSQIEYHSELQNRNLQTPPTLTSQSLKDRSFIQDYDKFISDHLIFSNELLSLKTNIELFIGKDKVNDIYITDSMLLEDICESSNSKIKDNINAINYFANIYKDIFQTDIMLVPTATEIYSNNLPQYSTKYDQVACIDNIYNNLGNIATTLANAQLISNSAHYLYYRTDTNLTSYGSYILYTTLAKELGYKPIAVDRFNIEYASHDFLGNLHSRILYGDNLKDTINLYHYSGENPIQDVIKYEENGARSYSSMFFREFLDTKNQSDVFLGDHEAIMRVRGTNKNGKKILIFRDETANQLMQFLPLHYDEIALVDLNLLQNTIFENIDMFDYDQVLFLYSIDTFINELNINLQLL